MVHDSDPIISMFSSPPKSQMPYLSILVSVFSFTIISYDSDPLASMFSSFLQVKLLEFKHNNAVALILEPVADVVTLLLLLYGFAVAAA